MGRLAEGRKRVTSDQQLVFPAGGNWKQVQATPSAFFSLRGNTLQVTYPLVSRPAAVSAQFHFLAGIPSRASISTCAFGRPLTRLRHHFCQCHLHVALSPAPLCGPSSLSG